jgi:hypothetical protein
MWAEDHGGCEERKINERNVRMKKKKPDPMSRVKDMHHIPLAIACERLDENLEKTNGKNNLKKHSSTSRLRGTLESYGRGDPSRVQVIFHR